MMLESETAQADGKFLHDVIYIRRHLEQSRVKATCDGVRVSVRYQVSVPISSDIGTLVPRLLSHIFNYLIFIAI